MSIKGGGIQQGRRTPLSLTGIPKLQTNQQQRLNTNGNSKNDQKNQQKTEPVVNDGKDIAKNDKKSENFTNNKTNGDKKQELQQNGTEKKTTNNDLKEKTDKKTTNNDLKEKTDKNEKKQDNKVAAKEKEAKEKSIADTKEKNIATKEKDNNVTAEKKDNKMVNDKKSNAEKSAAKVVQQSGINETKPVPTTATRNNPEDVAMDISTKEELSKPGTATPKRPVREKKTVSPTKPVDKLLGSPSVVISKADKAAAVAAAAVVVTTTPMKATDGTTTNTTTSNANTTPTKPENNENGIKNDNDDQNDKQDVEMETIILDPSPIKSPVSETFSDAPLAITKNTPAATSTPGKPNPKFAGLGINSDMELPIGGTPDRNTYARSYTQINGRRSIHPIKEYIPSKLERNLQFRESYRRINTELDVSVTTNTSMNVTVGSEIPNNSSFSSFFQRGRKRDRTPSNLSLAGDMQSEVVTSPPKRARLENFLNIVASPITLLRNRFAKTSLQKTKPVKLQTKLACDEDIDSVQNLSGGDENMPNATDENVNANDAPIIDVEEVQVEEKPSTEEDITVGQEADAESHIKDTSNTNASAHDDNNAAVVEQGDNVDIDNDAAVPIVDDINSEAIDDIQIYVKEKERNTCVIM